MVLGKIFGGYSNINPKYWDSDLQGQGFDSESATKLSSLIRRKNLSLWGSMTAAILAIPLSARARVIAIQRFNKLSLQFVPPQVFNFFLALGITILYILSR